MLVNFWSQSCVPCVTEMPLLEAAHKANPAVAFVGVDVLDRVEDARAMARRTGISYPWVLDEDGSFTSDAQTATLPTTLLLDSSHAVVAAKVGAFDSGGELQRWIDRHLEGP